MSHWYRYAYIIILLFSIEGISVIAADQNVFNEYGIEVEGKIYGYVLGDVNGDDLQDIIFVYRPISDFNTRYLALNLQSQLGTFTNKPDYVRPLDKDVAHLGTSDINEDGKDEIILIKSSKIDAYDFSSEEGIIKLPKSPLSRKTIYAFPFIEGISVNRFLFDINDSPGDEMIIPTEQGYEIYEQGDRKGEYRILNRLDAPIVCNQSPKGLSEFSYANNNELHLKMADIYVIDGNLDGRKDIYLLWDRKICTYFQDESGNFPQDPDVSVQVFPPYFNGYFQSRLVDCNGDRRPDLVVSYTSGGITSAETKVRFHLANPDGKINELSRKEITLSDSHCNLIIDDFNHDGQPDLAIPAVELGALSVTQMFLMKKTDIHLLIYSLLNGLPGDEAEKRLKYDFKFNFDDQIPTDEISIDWSADFNGDRLKDMVFTNGRSKVSFYWGEVEDYLSTRPDVELSIDNPARVFPVQLDNDGKTDLVIRHNFTGKYDRLTILKNKRGTI